MVTRKKTLSGLRFLVYYNRMVAKKSLNPNRLPPTIASATEYILKAYLRFHNWVMINAESLNPLDYGWKLAPGGTYESVATKAMIAPESILRCSCRKYGFNCLPA